MYEDILTAILMASFALHLSLLFLFILSNTLDFALLSLALRVRHNFDRLES